MPCKNDSRPLFLLREFYDRPTLAVTADLIGKVLVHQRRGVRTSGVIVEVEAYIGESDPACHAARGPTPRNGPLYGAPGHAYVYLNYGIHCLMNIVTEATGFPAAILIRALDPLEGLAAMRRRRRRPGQPAVSDHDLCRGPGNLTSAMGITLGENRCDLVGSRLFVEDCRIAIGPVAWGPRIGIKVGTERPWRAYLVGQRAVSGPRVHSSAEPSPRTKRTRSLSTSGPDR